MLKAVLFDFNGIIINDEPLHEKLINQLLLEENLRPKPGEFRQFCLGRNDRACIVDLLKQRGRVVTDDYADKLIARKALLYKDQLDQLETLPVYPGLEDLLFKLRAARLKLAIVSGALQVEIELVLQRLKLSEHFPVIVSGDHRLPSKPEPNGYLLAVDRLNQLNPGLHLKPSDCLAIEDTFAGIEAAKRAHIPVVGVANTYPFHMLQRRANWAVDYLSDLELDRIQQLYEQMATAPKAV
ncbi:HAD family hydrolase [Stenomitos frigidus]|uniref:HAD family phosphatase n=1 Tax=Stenomitos frigidus ULC18 TaxID=2107698 RepID=A0A2T1E9J2_9CYAN|nr:HAD family phosphatase [Stenomitos frigidus]PSB29416.1 HAD family phosphatase [Stenomitos frigidus ULC18]